MGSKAIGRVLWLCLFALAISFGCTTNPTNETPAMNDTPSSNTISTISGKFAPPPGRTLLFIGQDYQTATDYMAAIPEPIPAGFTTYTSLKNLEGLTEPADYGAGPVYLGGLAADYPDSAIALGLHVVDYLDEIVNGEADGQIDKLLDILAAQNRPIFVRFGYEVDGAWNHHEPEPFKQAWHIFSEKINERDIDNIALVWQTAAYCDGTYKSLPIKAWYPGDEVVDWIAYSHFTQADCNYEPINELLAFAREHNKPVMIAEAAPQRYQLGRLDYSVTGRKFDVVTAEEIWAAWYNPFFATIEENSDIIRAVAYINTHWDEQPMWGPPYENAYWGDSRVQANPIIQERWQAKIAEPNWLFAEELQAELTE